MDLLLALIIKAALSANRLLLAYVIWPLIRFAFGYVIYLLTGSFITFLWKLRHEYFNQDLRLKPEGNKDRALLITGAGSGIGLALVKHFHKHDFVVFACYYRNDEPGYKQLEELATSPGARLFLVQVDISSEDSIKSCYSTIRAILDANPTLKLHALINVAGIGIFQKFQWTSMRMIRNIVNTNLTGSLMMARQFLHLLIEGPCGRIINVASPMSFIPVPYGAVYGPTKAGLAQFSSVLESELALAHPSLKTVTIHPGNLLQKTSIISASLNQKMGGVLEELNEDERLLYENELTEHQRILEKTDRAFLRGRSFERLRPMMKVALLIEGGIVEDRLEDSPSFINSFDNSVCLKDPPRELLAGNLMFNLIFGSIIQWAPKILTRDFALMIQNSQRARSQMVKYKLVV